MGEVCPYCHSDEIPLVSTTSSKTSVKITDNAGKSAAAVRQGPGERPQKTQIQRQQKSEAANVEGNQQMTPVWGEQVVHCDGCDRPCHLRCIFGAHGASRSQPAQQHEQQKLEEVAQQMNEQEKDRQEQNIQEGQQPQKHRQGRQQQPKEPLMHPEGLLQTDAPASIQEPPDPSSFSEGLNDASSASPQATQPFPEFGVISGGESVDDVYRWFVEGDCKWFCCVCRLQWERMATAMNFSVDWRARKVLSEGNPLLSPFFSDVGTTSIVAPKSRKGQVEQTNTRDGSYRPGTQAVVGAAGSKRRGCNVRANGLSAHSKRPKRGTTESSSSYLSRNLKGVFGTNACEGCHQETFSSTKGGRDSRQETDGSDSQRGEVSGWEAGASMGSAPPCVVDAEPPFSDAAKRTGEAGESFSSCQADFKTARLSEKLTEATPLTRPEEVPVNLAVHGSETPQIVKEDVDAVSALPIGTSSVSPGCRKTRDGTKNGEPTDVRPSDADGGVEKKHANGLVIEEAMRVYKNSSEKRQNSKMQPCPVALTPEEYSSEELLGCRTDMPVEPRALLGSLQPCVHCYKLYGTKASVEVCRLTKRHLASNWDHPHFVSPAQIQDALLTCFQDALLTVQKEHQQKLQKLFDNMTPLQRGANMNALMVGNRQPRIHENAARRSAENTQKPQVHETETVWKGSIPLLCVTLGKTRVDYQFPDGPSKKKWYYGVVSNYQAISSKVADADAERNSEGRKEDEKEKKITYYTNQFRIDYNDGDFQTVPPHELIEMLIETGPGSKLDGRKAITTTPLVKMLSPELKRASRRVNQLVRETNRKGCVVESESDDE